MVAVKSRLANICDNTVTVIFIYFFNTAARKEWRWVVSVPAVLGLAKKKQTLIVAGKSCHGFVA